MSLSTLLEAAKYLDYLDSNNQQQQNQLMQLQSQPPTSKKPGRRQRFSKKNAADTMVAMSLPASTGPIQMQGVPIPVASNNGTGGHSGHQAASLSSSFTTGSPLSSFASTALFCSKASGATSASSSAASSLSSSDSSSSCGEILMGDNDFNQSPGTNSNNSQLHNNNNNNNHHNYHITHQQQFETNNHQQTSMHQFSSTGSSHSNQSVARYIAATSTGPQLVTMTTNNSAIASASVPIEGSIRAGHVINAANNASALTGTSFDARHFSLADPNGIHQHHHQAFGCSEGQTFSVSASSFSNDKHFGGSAPSSCPPMIMARVQPMILNSLSPSAQSIMAFPTATASSPTSSSSSYSRHRELHKTLEKNRRAHLRHCFELLKAELPASECVDKKTSHINIIKSAIRYVLALRQQEFEIDNELQRLTKIKTDLTENLSKLRTNQPIEQKRLTLPCEIQNQQQEQQSHQQQQQPVAEQQLSFLLSQSKID